MPDNKPRCPWASGHPLYVDYHDREWGVPEHDDRRLFELLILEGAQAGLSWLTILRKRENFRRAFDGFDPEKMAQYDRQKIDTLLCDAGIIRNRRKIDAAIGNARVYLAVVAEFGSFDAYIWSLAGGKPVRNDWQTLGNVPPRTVASDGMSADLKRRGFAFVGSTICYAFMQATGMVNDHLVGCFRHAEIG
jgi:DNA-3-methyladenine glycosylase I